MTPAGRLLRAAHVLVAGVELASLGYVWTCALTGRRGRAMWVAVTALVAEGAALGIGRGDCPLGPLQQRLGDPVPLFELVLPRRAARAAVPALTGVACLGLAVIAARSARVATRRELPRSGPSDPAGRVVSRYRIRRHLGDGGDNRSGGSMNTQSVARPVVVGVDGSESALNAVRWAAGEAQRRGAILRLVNAVGWTSTPHVANIGLGQAAYHKGLMLLANSQLDAAAESARTAVPGLEIEKEARDGYPPPILTDESKHAELLVVGNRGRGGFLGLMAGSVAVTMAACAACPVVVVRESLSESPGSHGDSATASVIVGVDGSPSSQAALAFAFDEALLRRAPLVAVHTWLDQMLEPTTAALIDWVAIEADQHALLAEQLEGWAEKFPDVKVTRVVARDLPARTLVEQSKRAQLVVVGSRGRGGIAGLLLGSVSQALVHHADCAVAVIHKGEAS
ncbi:MAG: UspA protein [Pseudonocardia sp.]|nr:UspA protein [Pseudonocardia sp.]